MTPRSAALLLTSLCLFGMAPAAMSTTPKHTHHGTPTEYTVSTSVIGPASPVGHGSIVPTTQQVDENGMASVTITPDPGYLLTAVDASACLGVDNGDGTWTLGPIQFDCQIVATFVLDSSDVVFQGDLESDVRVVDNLDAAIPANLDGININWETAATCISTTDDPCGSAYHFRPAASLYVLGHIYLVFRWPTNDDADLPGTARSYGVVSTIDNDDPDNPYPLAQALVPGDTVGPDQYFDYPGSTAGAGAWISPNGVDAYVGFQFVNSVSGRINYGYAHLVTEPSTNGFPATITDYAYDRRGNAIVIP